MEQRHRLPLQLHIATCGLEDVQLDIPDHDVDLASPSADKMSTYDAVYSPATPHPDTMAPPPPPGEPPQLVRNKRPHSFSKGSASGIVDRSTPLDVDAAPVVAADRSLAQAPSYRSLSQDNANVSSPADSSSSGEEDGSRCGFSDMCAEEDDMLEEPRVDESDELQSVGCRPTTPPGPPPAKMAPPPPNGPPPSLPMDRSELKRGAEHEVGVATSPSQQLGKRLRADATAAASTSLRPQEVPGGSTGSASRSSSVVSSSSHSSAAVVSANEQSTLASKGAVVETSYAQSPASARWIWDRLLSQDSRASSAVALEKRMLLALESLSCGAAAEASCSDT